jgi:hypothetical protein
VVNNLFPQFLVDPEQYRLSEQYWEDVWSRVDPFYRVSQEWIYPWLGTGSQDIKDGNPIFSAYSPLLRRGIRVIQEEPIRPGLDIQAWLDTFGGDITDPDRIHELVISCALSDAASRTALALMNPWVRGQPITFKHNEAGLLLPSEPHESSRRVRALGRVA